MPGYEILGESVNGYYEINGELSNDIIIFNIAQMKEPNCNPTVVCTPKLGFNFDNIYPENVTEFINNAQVCSEPISLQISFNLYSGSISTGDITFAVGYDNNICGSVGNFITIKLKLIYNAVLSNEELLAIATARSLANISANRAVNATATAATSAAGAQAVAITAANNGNLNLTQIQAAFTAASNAYIAAVAASNSAIAAAAVAATATTVGAATTAANNAIQQADIAESQSAIAAEQAAIARSLL